MRVDAEPTARGHAVCNTAAAIGGTTSFTEHLHNKTVTQQAFAFPMLQRRVAIGFSDDRRFESICK